MNRPQELERKDFTALNESVNDYFDFLDSDDYHEDREDDYTNDIFEKAVEIFYGKEAWVWINSFDR